MGTFNEADHPRDDIGRFTFKNGGGDSSGSNVVLEGKVEKTDSNSGGGSSIGEKAGEILNIIVSTVTNPQVVQAALNIALTVKSAQEQHKLLKRLYENYEQEKKMEDRANILYPTMKNKEKEEVKSDNNSKIEEPIKNESNKYNWQEDKDFNKAMEYLYPREGNYTNRMEDLGGPTNLGVTQSTFDWYNKVHNLPQKDVKNITKGEAEQIYHNHH